MSPWQTTTLRFFARATRRILAAAGLGGLMAMTEVEKSSHLIMERTFYTKLGPTPAFPPSPAETGQVKPAHDDEPLINPQSAKR